MNRSKSPRPKRYYRRLAHLPEGADRLAVTVHSPVTEEQIEGWVAETLGGGMKDMKAQVGYIILRYGAWGAAMNLAQCDNPQMGFRAAWGVEWAYEQSEPGERPEWFFDRLTHDFIASKNGSLHRIYGKMICDAMRFGGFSLVGTRAERLAEKCFDLAIAPATKSAVMFWCLEILTELAPRIGWVAEELPETVRHISEAPDCSPGLRVATREILRRLR
jgi:hypothetical protein